MIKIKKSVLKLIQKALNEQPKTLSYFKKEFINILKKQYDELDKKESKEKSFEKSIMLYAGDVFIEKGRAANIGEVREWKGRKFKKIAQGKWRPIYESASRGAKQSIKLLAKKISKVNSTDELMEIIMQNVNRFQDENGKILPIVEELKNAVNEKKQSLNAGKPTTKKVAPKTEEKTETFEEKKDRIHTLAKENDFMFASDSKWNRMIVSNGKEDLYIYDDENVKVENGELVVYGGERGSLRLKNVGYDSYGNKKEAPKTEEKAESSNSSESKDLSNNKFANLKEPIKPSFIKGKWNGKIYGDEKYGYRIYVDNNEFTLSKNEYEELHKYNIDHKEWETENLYKRLATSKISSKILKDLGTVIERFNSYSEENLNKLKELKNKFQNTDLITGIKDKFYTNLLDDVKDGRLRQKGLSQLPQPSKDDVKAIIEIFKNDKAFRDEIKNRCLEKITNEINKLERQAKEIQEGKEYNERYNNDEEFRKKEREKNQKQADRIKEIAGEGYWNGKVYGSAKNGYSIYVKNKKYTIPESDYELFDLKKSFPERISEILKSLK